MIRLWEKFKAWRRDEVMLPGVSRGRCFVPKDSSRNSSGGVKKIAAKPRLKLIGMKVIRVDGSTEEIM